MPSIISCHPRMVAILESKQFLTILVITCSICGAENELDAPLSFSLFQSHTHIHTLLLSLSVIHTLFLPLLVTHTLFLSLSVTHTLFLSLKRFHYI